MSYIYGLFYRFGLIDVPDKVKEKMAKQQENETYFCFKMECDIIKLAVYRTT